MDKQSLVRTIYLYLFALVGLTLLVIAGVRFIDMALKAFIFTKADEELRIEFRKIPLAPVPIEKLETISQEADGKQIQVTLRQEEVQQINQWLADYKTFKENYEKIDPITTKRQRDASINLAMIIIGLPLYLYHWGIIKQEMHKK